MKELSSKQRRILECIGEFLEQKGYPPTVRDIQRGCGISSTSVVDYNLNILERLGYIRRDPDVSRGIGIVDSKAQRSSVRRVPIIGWIAAGEPIPVPAGDTWAPRDYTEFLELPQEMAADPADTYALRVRGTSMIDALIDDGDIVVMRAVATAENGDMVAAWLKREKECTLKRLYVEGDKVRLQPANRRMKPIVVKADDVEVQGKVIGVIRLC